MVITMNFSKKGLILITGASKGIGRALSIEISRSLPQNSILVLMARSKTDLDETKNSILEVDKSLTVLTICVDLTNFDKIKAENTFSNILKNIDTNGIEFGMIIHNAGYVGELKQTTDLIDIDNWRKYFDLNLFSVAILNAYFIKTIRPIAPQLYVLNITSLCGREPFKNLAQYGAAKAARELFFKVLAVEEPNIIVLNYSPGPVNTDMFNSIVETAQSSEVRETFQHVKKTSVLTPIQTVSKLLKILEKGEFKSGDTIDYFD